MLKQRVITALALVAVLLPALFQSSPVPFVVVALVMLAAAAWEWSRLNGTSQGMALAVAAVFAALCAGLWAQGLLERPLGAAWSVLTLVWVLGGAWVLSRGPAGWTTAPQALRFPLGLFALVMAWMAVAQARVAGINFLLSVLCLVWVADIGAYFAGRAFGGRFIQRKLAITISPGKSWEGVFGGALCVLLLAFAWMHLEAVVGDAWGRSLYWRLWSSSPWRFFGGLVLLTGMSVVGDLVESLVKRSAGVKDSSGLLPGHGGVLDRLDALLPTLPIAMGLLAWL